MRKVLKIARLPKDGNRTALVIVPYIGPVNRIPAGWVLVMRRVRHG